VKTRFYTVEMFQICMSLTLLTKRKEKFTLSAIITGASQGSSPELYLEHVLLGAFEVLESPLIHSAVHTSRHKLGVIRQPRQAPHLSIMPPVLKSLQ